LSALVEGAFHVDHQWRLVTPRFLGADAQIIVVVSRTVMRIFFLIVQGWCGNVV
jgi:hypothetical protein